MKTLDIGTTKYTQVLILDEPSHGGACHNYRIVRVGSESSKDPAPELPFGRIHFQEGPVKEHGVNGCHQEDLLAILIHRLRCFQDGPYACRENALALTKLEEAMHWLQARTQRRERRGVEGTNEV